VYSFGGGSDGSNPHAGLVLAGSTLYGTTYSGGASSYGVVFKVNTDGAGFAVLHSFSGYSDGCGSISGLVLGGSTLYGTTVGSLGFGNCTVFQINTDGSGYHSHVAPNYVEAGLAIAGSVLYGTAAGSDAYTRGEIFRVNQGMLSLNDIWSFDGSNGADPMAGLLVAGGALYGTTYYGGSGYSGPQTGSGVAFRLDCLSILAPPLPRTAEAGSTVALQVRATSLTPGLAYQWFTAETNALVGATNAFLVLTNIQSADAGAYRVMVTNMGMTLTSAPAMLSVIPRVESRSVPGVLLTGGPASLVHVDYADSLAPPQWFSLSNMTLGGGTQPCFDLSQPLPALRFYRAWQTNPPPLALEATMATAISVTGAIGNSVRIDYINAIGPTNAWVTLTTVTLTNTSQLYFDTSAPGQQKRLYRLVPVP
jgi:uncharacterized repeat protein (TIGR03803 family)